MLLFLAVFGYDVIDLDSIEKWKEYFYLQYTDLQNMASDGLLNAILSAYIFVVMFIAPYIAWKIIKGSNVAWKILQIIALISLVNGVIHLTLELTSIVNTNFIQTYQILAYSIIFVFIITDVVVLYILRSQRVREYIK